MFSIVQRATFSAISNASGSSSAKKLKVSIACAAHWMSTGKVLCW